MFLAEKSPRSYVGLYQKFLYKSFSLLLTPLPNILLTPHLMQRWPHMGQGAQCSIILKNMRPSAVVSAYFPNALPTQLLDNLRVTHQDQVTHHGLSCEAIFFSSDNVPGETFRCVKKFTVIWEEGPAEGLFDK